MFFFLTVYFSMLTAIRDLGIWCFAFVDIINWTLLSLIVVGYSTFNLSMFMLYFSTLFYFVV